MAQNDPAVEDSRRKSPSSHRTLTWTYQPYPGAGDPQFAIMAGDLIIALVKEKGDADLICRARNEVHRMGVDSRRNNAKIRALGEENKLLMAALRRIMDIVQKSTSPNELINARSEVSRVMKKMNMGGR